jgi:hypothetical protein
MGVRIVNENQTGRGKKHDARLEAGLWNLDLCTLGAVHQTRCGICWFTILLEFAVNLAQDFVSWLYWLLNLLTLLKGLFDTFLQGLKMVAETWVSSIQSLLFSRELSSNRSEVYGTGTCQWWTWVAIKQCYPCRMTFTYVASK